MKNILASCAVLLVCIPAVAAAAFDVDLRRGDRGNTVIELQQFLIAQGVLGAGNVTAYFGPLTHAAVQAFQVREGIQPPAGFFGPITRMRARILAGSTGQNFLPTDDVAARIVALLQQVAELERLIARLRNRDVIEAQPPIVRPAEYASCTLNGLAYQHNTVVTVYNTPTSASCDTIRSTRTCANGEWTGSDDYQYTSCTSPATISVSMPQITDYIDRGYTVPVSWQNSSAPGGSYVYLELLRADNSVVGIIKDRLMLNTSYNWVIPSAQVVPRTGGYYLLEGSAIADGGTYKIRATLYIPTSAQCYEGCPPTSPGSTVVAQATTGTFRIGHY